VFASVTGRTRRSLWATLSFVFVVGIVASVLMARVEESQAIHRAASAARDQAQQLSQELANRDLSRPASGEEYRRVARDVHSIVTSKGSVTRVVIWSSDGRVLFDADRELVGTTPSETTGPIASVSSGSGLTLVRGDSIQTFVPVSKWKNGPAAVMQIGQPLRPVLAQTSGMWGTLQKGLMLAVAVTLSLLALTFLPAILRRVRKRRAERTTAPRSPAPAGRFMRVRRTARPSHAPDPAYMLPGFRQIEEARRAAEERARSSEESFQSLQAQLERTVEQVKTLKAGAQADGALRDRLRAAEAKTRAAEARVIELEDDLDKQTVAARSTNG
jgi:hypothetical protein